MRVKGLNVWEVQLLRQLGCNMYQRFGCPIYLVGSAITSKDPLDIDIIMVMDHDQQYRLWGLKDEIEHGYINNEATRAYTRQVRFLLKQKKYFDMHMPHWDFDFKIQSPDHFEKFKKDKKLRLDVFEGIA